MNPSTNPFVVLSYVSGPALLTNASSLLLLSTANRFARAVDRSRELVARVRPTPEGPVAVAEHQELHEIRHRVRHIANAMTCLYLAASMFGLATLLSIIGAVLEEMFGGSLLSPIVVIAATAGVIGFLAFVASGIILVVESRLAMHGLVRESDAAISVIDGAIAKVDKA